MMQCDEVQNLLAAYLDGGLAEDSFKATRAAIAQHVQGCESCRAERERLLATLKVATRVIQQAGEAIPVPDVHWGEIPAPQKVSTNPNHLRSHPMNEQIQSTMLAKPRGSFAAGFAFALVLILLAAGALMFNAIHQPQYGGAIQASYQVGDVFKVSDIHFSASSLLPRDTLIITAQVKTLQEVSGGYSTAIQIVGENGVLVTGDAALPFINAVDGLNSILPDQTLTLTTGVEMPDPIPLGSYRVLLGFYRADTGERLPAQDEAGNPLENGLMPLGTVEIAVPADSTQATVMAEVLPAGTVTPVVPITTPMPTVAPTVDPMTGGFLNNPIDVSTLPEYILPVGGGGGGGGGGGCPDIPADQTVAIFHASSEPEWLNLCLYDIPDLNEGTQFTAKLTSPAGKAYLRTYVLGWQDGMMVVIPQNVQQQAEVSFIESGTHRTPIDISLYFPAAQEYGEWKVEAALAGAMPFAQGSITVETDHPIYSVTDINDPLDPFAQPIYEPFKAGDHVLIAGRGVEINATGVLALYSTDPARMTSTSMVMMPYYAAQVTVTQDSLFRAEFVVGQQTPAQNYNLLLNPDPAEFKPLPNVMLWVRKE
jgi:hypothetical protein